MSLKQIVVLAALGVANLCVLGLGAALLISSPAPQPVATPIDVQAIAMLTASAPPLPTNTPSPVPPTITPTRTRWPTLTPYPTASPYPTWAYMATAALAATPAETPAPKSRSTAASLPATAPRPATVSRPTSTPNRGSPVLPGKRIGCGTPNGQPTNGKLDVFWSFIAWEPLPDSENVRGTIEIIPSGGNDCYKYNFMGNTYDYEPITFIVRKCGSTPVNLTVTSRDGQKWSQDFIIESGENIGLKCK